METKQSQGEFPPAQPPAHQPMSIRGRMLAGLALATLISAVVLHLGLKGMFDWFLHSERSADVTPAPVVLGRPIPPAPRLQVDPSVDRVQMQQVEDAVLHRSGVDPQSGAAYMPIERAMELVARRARPAAAQTQPATAQAGEVRR